MSVAAVFRDRRKTKKGSHLKNVIHPLLWKYWASGQDVN